MLFWVRPLYERVVLGVSWETPSWKRAPVSLGHPLEFFHVFGLGGLAMSLGMVLSQLMGNLEPTVACLLPGSFGLGVLLGVVLLPRNTAAR
jgi:hypothetical protein